MKHLICIILFGLVYKPGFSQNNAKIKKFINEVITEKNINYQDSVDNETRRFMHEGLVNTRVVYKFREDSVDYEDRTGIKRIAEAGARRLVSDNNHFDRRLIPIVADSLVLTDAEIAFADSEIDKMRNYKLTSNLIPDSKLLFTDSLIALQKYWDNLRNKPISGMSKAEREKWMKGLIEKSQKQFIAYYKLSSPIFLRDDNYCLFYYGTGCINTIDWGCGGGTFMVYKKVNGNWVYWGDILRWMV